MKQYLPYLKELRHLLLRGRESAKFRSEIDAAVNGQASAKLDLLVPRSLLKRSGAFFSNSALAKEVASDLTPPSNGSGLAATDPACGAGNLLLAAAQKLPVHTSLKTTLAAWGKQLAGFDLHSEFIEATHLRLALFALHSGAHFDLDLRVPLDHFFPHIRTQNGICGLASLPEVGHLLINPPFNRVTAPADCKWGQGKINRAALFVSECLDLVPEGTKISAILPDVLRSGSRYRRWRESLETAASITRIESMGNFQTADVDVFVIDLTVTGKSAGLADNVRWWDEQAPISNIGDHFTVHVGPVVKHRLKRNHPVRPYLHAKGLPFWGELGSFTEQVKFEGPLVRPPFVVIRRTSSPTDRHRAIATIISGKKALAVDNHLIYCAPLDGGKQKCRELIDVLKDERTNSFLNRRIRCRHLTVGVVKEIPWKG